MAETPFLYSQPVLDLVRVAAEYCKQLENAASDRRDDFLEKQKRLLPMIYLKMLLLPPQAESEGFNEPAMNENDYEFVRSAVAKLLGEQDTYLDVFVENFKYSDKPVLQTISENLADIYQPLREFVEVFRKGYEDAMMAALWECRQQFAEDWGQKLVNTLRAVHEAAAKPASED